MPYFDLRYCCLYGVYHLKHNQTTVRYCDTKLDSESGPSPSNRLFQSAPMTLKVTLVASPLPIPLAEKLCTCKQYIHEQNVFIPKHNFASKSCATVCELFSNTYSNKEVLNKIKHWLVTSLRWQVLLKQHNWNYSSADSKQCTSCNKRIWLQELNTVSGFVVLCKGVHV